jgi:nucleotide-binding universal stress UspA family protein
MTLFRTILFAADFTEKSRAAFRFACSLADERETQLSVLHVIERMPVVEQSVAFGDKGKLIPLVEGGLGHHAALEQRLHEMYVPERSLDVSFHVRDGFPVDEVLRMADEISSDLVVLGTHGRTGLSRLLTGSVAEGILQKSRCPVAVLRSSADSPEIGPIATVLCATDFSTASEAAVQVARSIAREHGAKLIVAFVIPIDVVVDGSLISAPAPQSYRDALESVRTRLEGPDLKHPVEVRLGEGDIASELRRLSDAAGVDLVVIGTHGRSGLRRFLMGSVAESVLRSSRSPVLAVKSGADALETRSSNVSEVPHARV